MAVVEQLQVHFASIQEEMKQNNNLGLWIGHWSLFNKT